MPITDLIQELMIVKGVAKPLIDASSAAEKGLVSLDLMATDSGWCLESEEGWNPIIPSLKAGGVWADSAVSSGRQLLSNEEANVVETMHFIVTGDTAVDLARHLRNMGRMIQDARDFWATHWQIEPVYIRWHAKGAPGPQFALIYNIEMAIVEPDTYSANIRDITITIEREPYWRPIPPGANPKLWTAEFRGDDITTAADLYLATSTFANARNNLVQDNNVDNRREWNVGQTGLLSKNWVDIPAASIPGDAPALVCFAMRNGNFATEESVVISRQVKPSQYTARDGGTEEVVYILNAGDNSALGTDATVAADTGAPASNNQATGQRVAVSFATATHIQRLAWGSTGGETTTQITLQRGLYAAFLRCRVSAAATVSLQLKYGGQNAIIENAQVSLTDVGAGGTGNTTLWAWVYMGTVRVPVNEPRISVSLDGEGVSVNNPGGAIGDLSIRIFAGRSSGAGVLYLSDLILAPFDEASFIAHAASLTDIAAYVLVYDNTGYFMHGQLDDYAGLFVEDGTNAAEYDPVEIQGGRLTLVPGQVNRIHTIAYDRGANQSVVQRDNSQVYINIVPRWRGVRDV